MFWKLSSFSLFELPSPISFPHTLLQKCVGYGRYKTDESCKRKRTGEMSGLGYFWLRVLVGVKLRKVSPKNAITVGNS